MRTPSPRCRDRRKEGGDAVAGVSTPQKAPVPTADTMWVAVGSTSQVKVDAVGAAFKRAFPDWQLEVHGVESFSGVPDQPFGDVETKRGAANRAVHAARVFEHERGRVPHFSVGLEGGIGEVHGDCALTLGTAPDALESFAWMAVLDATGKWGLARSASFQLPSAVAELVRKGMELGDADDRVFGRRNSKAQAGAVGILTHGQIDRRAYYEHPLMLALVPFVNPGLF